MQVIDIVILPVFKPAIMSVCFMELAQNITYQDLYVYLDAFKAEVHGT